MNTIYQGNHNYCDLVLSFADYKHCAIFYAHNCVISVTQLKLSQARHNSNLLEQYDYIGVAPLWRTDCDPEVSSGLNKLALGLS